MRKRPNTYINGKSQRQKLGGRTTFWLALIAGLCLAPWMERDE